MCELPPIPASIGLLSFFLKFKYFSPSIIILDISCSLTVIYIFQMCSWKFYKIFLSAYLTRPYLFTDLFLAASFILHINNSFTQNFTSTKLSREGELVKRIIRSIYVLTYQWVKWKYSCLGVLVLRAVTTALALRPILLLTSLWLFLELPLALTAIHRFLCSWLQRNNIPLILIF